MSFKSLEERFTESSRQLYTRFTNTNTSQTILPDSAASRSRIKDDDRSLPVVSTVRDNARISNFLGSNKGSLFIAKQLLLQTGNTFAETRLFNPLNVRLNTVPFLHLVRHAGRPFFNLRTPTREYRGALQKESIENNTGGNFLTRGVSGVLNAATSPFKVLLVQPEILPSGFYKRPEDAYTDGVPLFNSQLLKDRGDKKLNKSSNTSLQGIDAGFYPSNIHNISKKILLTENKRGINKTVPKAEQIPVKYNASHRDGRDTYLSKLSQSKLKNSVFNLNPKKTEDPIFLTANLEGLNNPGPLEQPGQTLTTQLNKYLSTRVSGSSTNPTGLTFKQLEAAFAGNGYFSGSNTHTIIPGVGQTVSDILNKSYLGVIQRIKDPYNLVKSTEGQSRYAALAGMYDTLEKERIDKVSGIKSDIIKFIFGHPSNGSKIHFRAFISSFKENVKPEFAEQRYIGRTERFVTYSGVKRTASINFNIVAFSKEEIGTMWTRVNYLTGLAFPRGVSASGFMIPPLFRLTIGGIYDSQPVYIDTLEHEFIDSESITFDIDAEVSQVINVSLNVTLLEKESKMYDSPFYGITGN